eukprot:15444811-Alexandrium_andersonii.AAC.1
MLEKADNLGLALRQGVDHPPRAAPLLEEVDLRVHDGSEGSGNWSRPVCAAWRVVLVSLRRLRQSLPLPQRLRRLVSSFQAS